MRKNKLAKELHKLRENIISETIELLGENDSLDILMEDKVTVFADADDEPYKRYITKILKTNSQMFDCVTSDNGYEELIDHASDMLSTDDLLLLLEAAKSCCSQELDKDKLKKVSSIIEAALHKYKRPQLAFLYAVDEFDCELFTIANDTGTDSLCDCCVNCIGVWKEDVENDLKELSISELMDKYEFTNYTGELPDFESVKSIKIGTIDEFDMDTLRICPCCDEVLDGAYFIDEETAQFQLEKLIKSDKISISQMSNPSILELAALFKCLLGTDLDKNLIVKGNILLSKIEK